MKTRNISEFYFSVAEYDLKDRYGNNVILIIDYKTNKYRIESKAIPKKSYIEIENIALDLLERKHNTNFAEKS